LGLVPNYFSISYSGEFTALIHLVVLPILIIHRTRQAELAKDQALTRELAEAHRMERGLERRVNERTQELHQEIESRERLQVQLKDALATERAALANQRQFVAMLSHEVRTPLAIIDTTAQRLDMRLESTLPDLVPKVEKIRRAVQRLTHLLENCLAAERLDGKGLELHLEDFDLRAYLANHFAERMLADSHRILLNLPDEAVAVRCDRHLFEVALWNLVENALKYSPANRPVHLRLITAASAGVPVGQVAIEVRDEGAGVRPEDRERIFERFFRSEGLARIPGAGLGLHLAQVLARRHGGDLVLAPSEPGEGAIFVLTLPKVSGHNMAM
jgi:signal transduction histidine kinase